MITNCFTLLYKYYFFIINIRLEISFYYKVIQKPFQLRVNGHSVPSPTCFRRFYTLSMKRIPFIRVGLIFAISPLLLAFLTSIFQGISMWDEGSGSGGYIWLMMGTLPVGFVLIGIGLVRGIIRKLRK